MTECRFCLAVDTEDGRPEAVETRANGTTERIYVCPRCQDVLDLVGVDVVELVDGHPADQVKTGERIAESDLSGQRYRVTKWVDKGDGKLVALEKEPIEEAESQ